MEKLLSTTQSYTPVAWLHEVHWKDPDEQYIVTEVSHYKQRTPWPALQPEYLTLLVQLPLDEPQPVPAPVLIKVSRDPRASHPSGYRLCQGATDDRVTVLGPAANIELHDEKLHYLAWSLDKAPCLEIMSCFIACVHFQTPPFCLFLARCCYAFVHAMSQALHNTFSGILGSQQTQILVPDCYLVYMIPLGMVDYEEIANVFIIHASIFEKEEDMLEERMKPSDKHMFGASCLSYIFPVRLTTVARSATSA